MRCATCAEDARSYKSQSPRALQSRVSRGQALRFPAHTDDPQVRASVLRRSDHSNSISSSSQAAFRRSAVFPARLGIAVCAGGESICGNIEPRQRQDSRHRMRCATCAEGARNYKSQSPRATIAGLYRPDSVVSRPYRWLAGQSISSAKI
jgi:hypothetical protein